ncbi:hypothetical protein CCR75_009142 [Bremia lactucae]|uniref:DUF4460 domain-containing protein n=1 Tax=Bremia lactucae TaxID=4779 RepID=A0A976FK90_BRELC|nr:hypothetical protein CCR75_001531 [Bremia lactucae]TDH64902.1 hypothetical protein CCR75_005897 [Bremia lactucae]TDH64962.1 hypothetical protein CCR75_000586 [Bremia lactucae]TDH65092.1 hypothetical protein CCR75_008561 [Bremia lactucae]TDH65173.1 hypothetical protein CCR75_000608 [Bremia lactucae]
MGFVALARQTLIVSRFQMHASTRLSTAIPWQQMHKHRVPCSIDPPFLSTRTSSISFVRTKVSERTLRRKKLRVNKSQKGVKVPILKETLRKLYLRTHPDLFGQYPTQQRANEESYKELLGILDAIEKHNQFPPAKTLKLPFFLKTPIEGEFKEVELQLRTTGGACNTLVEEALGQFFSNCGLPEVFQWDKGSWGKSVGKHAVENPNLGFEKEDETHENDRHEAKREERHSSAPAYNPVDRKAPEDHSIEKVLNELDDTLQLIAVVPYLDDDDKQQQAIKTHFEHGSGLDDLDAQGYSLKAGVIQLWQGERNLQALIPGLDGDSAILMQRILLHTVDIEKRLENVIAQSSLDVTRFTAEACNQQSE